MKEIILYALHCGSKVAFAYIALLAVRENIPFCGWFVFLAVVYGLFMSLKVD